MHKGDAMSDLEATVAALEHRLRELEDRLAIYNLIATYGPIVDSGSDDALAEVFREDAVYDADPGPMEGRPAIAAMVRSRGHQGLIQSGAAHVMALPVVHVDGDRAVATGYSRVYRADGQGGFEVWRVSANRWELERDGAGWRTVHRVNRLLDGRDESRQMLRDGVTSA
jgi:hypothetical protein